MHIVHIFHPILLSLSLSLSLLSPSLVITIGWERTSYDATETDDMVELCALITSPAFIDRDPLILQVTCSPGSAGKIEDDSLTI